MATSTVLRRHWTVAGRHAHHLIDPETGEPSQSDVVSATVLAAHGWQAEVLAKAAIVAGLADALALIERTGADALLVDGHGDLHPRTASGASWPPPPTCRGGRSMTSWYINRGRAWSPGPCSPPR